MDLGVGSNGHPRSVTETWVCTEGASDGAQVGDVFYKQWSGIFVGRLGGKWSLRGLDVDFGVGGQQTTVTETWECIEPGAEGGAAHGGVGEPQS